jgi:hypothetical protein
MHDCSVAVEASELSGQIVLGIASDMRAVRTLRLHSVRSLTDVIYREELISADHGADVHLGLTRDWPRAGKGTAGVSTQLLPRVGSPADERPLIYVYGRSAFLGTVASTRSTNPVAFGPSASTQRKLHGERRGATRRNAIAGPHAAP